MSVIVPTIRQVQPGAAVSIVLKQDQRTGRQVQGVIQDVLTRGNHPRGIKVRLHDGRIGRVQRMVTEPMQKPSPDALRQDLRDQQVARGEFGKKSTATTTIPTTISITTTTSTSTTTSTTPATTATESSKNRTYLSERLNLRYTDMRNDDHLEEPPAEIDLMSFVKTAAKPKKGRGKKKAQHQDSQDHQDRQQDRQQDHSQSAESQATDVDVAEGFHAAVSSGSIMNAQSALGTGTGTGTAAPVTAVCPVCNDFQGDEAAVAHHVEGHFTQQ